MIQAPVAIWSRIAWAALGTLQGAEAVVRLRALRASGNFDDYWLFHFAKEHERNHQSRYADVEVPNLLPALGGRPHLKLV